MDDERTEGIWTIVDVILVVLLALIICFEVVT